MWKKNVQNPVRKRNWKMPVFGAALSSVFLMSNAGMSGQTLEPPVSATVTDVGMGPNTFSINVNGVCGSSSALNVTMPAGYRIIPSFAAVSGGSATLTEVSVSGSAASYAISGFSGTATITYQAEATCEAIGDANTNINYNLSTCSGASSSTGTANTRNAQINVVGISNGSYSGAPGSVYERVIQLRNDGMD